MYQTHQDTQLFAELYDVHPQAILWMRPIWSDHVTAIIDFEYAYCNEEGLRFMNLTQAQFDAGVTIRNSPTLPDELRPLILQEFIEIYTTGNKTNYKIFNSAVGKYARVTRARVKEGVLSVIQDISEEEAVIQSLEEGKRKLELQAQQLDEQKTLVESILKNSSNGISVSQVFRNEEGTVIDALTVLANDAAIQHIGLPRDIYLTKKATEIEPGIIGSPYYQQCIKTLETGTPFVMQYLMESTGRWLELTVSRLDYHHLIQVFTDITPIKDTQLQLERAASTLQSVFDAAQTGMFTFRPEYDNAGEIVNFRFVMVNKTVAAYAGKTPGELEGQLGTSWYEGYLTNGEFELYRHCFVTGEPQEKDLHFRAEGEEIFLHLQCNRIDDMLLVSLTDQTNLRQSQQKLEHTIKALERSNTHLEDFAHAASHDMKEPLRKILTFSSRLKESAAARLDSVENLLLQKVENAAERMQLLVDDLLEFSHVSETPGTGDPVDLNEKLQKVLTDLELSVEEKGAVIESDTLPIVNGNRRQLQQVFHNLVGNALKYQKPGVSPKISIRCRQLALEQVPEAYRNELHALQYHLIEVADNGIGFDQQYSERIFEMFQRLHGKAEYAGTGVGLAIVRKVVDNHGGVIWAEGKAGEGASFNILLPVIG